MSRKIVSKKAVCSPVVFESHNFPPSICLARREPRRVLCAAALGDVHAALGALDGRAADNAQRGVALLRSTLRSG